ncbi:hypothetical protein JB92DRAFT_2825597 [Gautieria morchelliformis]|nr:hypothetical protein JB92DRAFT_2825597 [Gautieria morchelliformis]
MSLELPNCLNKELWIQAVTPALWKAYRQQSKESYLYKEKAKNTVGYNNTRGRNSLSYKKLALKCTDDVERDRVEGLSSSVLKHGHDDNVQCEELPPLAPAPKRTLLGWGSFMSSPIPASKMPSFKKKVSK